MSRADHTEPGQPLPPADSGLPVSAPSVSPPPVPDWGKTWTEMSVDSPDHARGYGRLFSVAGVSIIGHIIAFIIFLLLPTPEFHGRARNFGIEFHQVTPLYLPKSLELTQKEANKEKAKQQLDVRSSLPQAPAAPRVFQPPAPKGPAKQQPLPLESAPDIPAAGGPQAPSTIVAGLPTIPRPIDNPKIVLEKLPPAPTNVKPTENSPLRIPRATAEDALRAASQAPGGPGGATSKGTAGDAGTLGGMQLMSDPEGVDFKPYLLQILTAVRRNWFGRIPDIARTGRPGQTVVQFIIDRTGGIPKLVIATPSGTNAYDLAAAGSVSASSPFPPLPSEFRGPEIRLQLAFSYNLPKAR